VGMGDEESYVDAMVEEMAEVFSQVRRRQDSASRANAQRRDEADGRYVATYNPDDCVLLYEPNSTEGLTTAVRPEAPPKEVQVPRKWCMRWTGPHRVINMKQGCVNVYCVWHIHKRALVTVNVADMRLFHPFVEIPFGGIPQVKRRRRKEGCKGPITPLRLIKGPDKADQIRPNDLFIAAVPSNGQEPVTLMRYVETKADGTIIAQWCGVERMIWHINTRLHRQAWMPAWIDPRDGRFYYKPAPIRPNHVMFTNANSQHDHVEQVHIVAFNFKLRKDLRLPRDVAQTAIRYFRNMEMPKIHDKEVRTYEDPAEDVL
jgi:hypothetical protein